MKQVYLLFLKSQFSKMIDNLLKQDIFIFTTQTVISEINSLSKDYYVFQVESVHQKERQILCFGEYYMVHTSKLDNYVKKCMEGKANADHYIAIREKIIDDRRKLFSNDANKWIDMINRFLSFEHVTQIGLFYMQTGVDTPFSIVELDLSEINMDTLLKFEENTLMLINKSSEDI